MRKLLLSLLATLMWMASATNAMADIIYDDVTVDGWKYSVNFTNGEAGLYRGDFKGDVTVPGEITIDGKTYRVVKLGYQCFQGCTGLVSVTLPSSIREIGMQCFQGCTALRAIYGYEHLNISTIEKQTFDGCTSLKSIVLPKTIQYLNEDCFKDCKSLESITIPGSVYTYRYSYFDGCDKLNHIILEEGNGRQKVIYPNAFKGCKSLDYIVALDHEPLQFFQPAQYKFDDFISPSLTKFYVSEGMEDIYMHRFIWQDRPIYGWQAARQDTVTIDGLNYKIHSVTHEATLIHGDYRGDVVVPEKVLYNARYCPVTKMVDYCFLNCEGLTSIKLPSTMTSTSYECFCNCTSLRSFDFPASITKWGYSTFDRCKALKHVIVPENVKELGAYCFAYCRMDTIEILGKVKELPFALCWSCINLKHISIPNTVTKIDYDCFHSCWGMEEITIPSSVCDMKGSVFDDCRSLRRIHFSDNLTALSSTTFRNCYKLTEIKLPASVERIDPLCFKNADSIITIMCEAVVPPVFSDVTTRASETSYLPKNLKVLYVPQASIDAYRAAEGWCDAPDIQAIETTGIDKVTTSRSESQAMTAVYAGESLVVSGLDDGDSVQVFSIDGRLLGKGKAESGIARIPMRRNNLVIVKANGTQIKVGI